VQNNVWNRRRAVAWLLGVVVVLLPAVTAATSAWATLRWFGTPTDRLAGAVALASAAGVGIVGHLVASRLLRTLLPLQALLAVSVVFPDRAPTRVSAALRANRAHRLARRMAAVGALPRDGAAGSSGPTAAAPLDGSPPSPSRPPARHLVVVGGDGWHGPDRSLSQTIAPEPHDPPAAAAARLLAVLARLGAHDPRTRGHGERVRAYAEVVGRRLGLDEQEVVLLGWAALLHDIGKIGVPREILNKPGRLSDDEAALIRRHPEIGDRLIVPLHDWLGPFADVALRHHERWDGGGYPGGLAGEDIPFGARIVAVVDAFDVMTTSRSYKRAGARVDARAELVRGAGTQFDPLVVRAFLLSGVEPIPGRRSAAASAAGWLSTARWPSVAADGLAVAGSALGTAAKGTAGILGVAGLVALPGAPVGGGDAAAGAVEAVPTGAAGGGIAAGWAPAPTWASAGRAVPGRVDVTPREDVISLLSPLSPLSPPDPPAAVVTGGSSTSRREPGAPVERIGSPVVVGPGGSTLVLGPARVQWPGPGSGLPAVQDVRVDGELGGLGSIGAKPTPLAGEAAASLQTEIGPAAAAAGLSVGASTPAIVGASVAARAPVGVAIDAAVDASVGVGGTLGASVGAAEPIRASIAAAIDPPVAVDTAGAVSARPASGAAGLSTGLGVSGGVTAGATAGPAVVRSSVAAAAGPESAAAGVEAGAGLAVPATSVETGAAASAVSSTSSTGGTLDVDGGASSSTGLRSATGAPTADGVSGDTGSSTTTGAETVATTVSGAAGTTLSAGCALLLR
jgi:HD-GYP domain-containing protein (c-di-GMP phosphodiesterase class II)